MARRILLLEPDVDAMGKLAEELRARGMVVVLASDAKSAVARTRDHGPHVLFIAEALAERDDVMNALVADPVLGAVPRVILVRAGASETLPSDRATYDDVDRLVTRALEVKSQSTPPETAHAELRGDISQLPLVDLLQLLAMNRRTGVLVVSTPSGAGELRVADGEVLDAVYRRLEGEKAFYRLLAERQGSFVFAPGGPPPVARVTKGTSALLMEAMRQKDEIERIREELGATEAWVRGDGASDDQPREVRDLLDALSVPRTMDELIDEVSAPDLDVLQRLRDLVASGLVRGVERTSLQAPLCPVEHVPVLRALVARLARAGFSPAARIAIAAAPQRIEVFAHALLRVAGVVPPAEPPRAAQIPHDLGTLRLGDGADVTLVGVPVVDRYAPLWSFALPGVGTLVRVEPLISPVLDDVARALELKVVIANDAVEKFDEANPRAVAQLLRGVIETAGAA